METTQIDQTEITLHQHQIKAWQSEKRFIFLCAGVQSGKTTLGSIWIVNEAQQCGPGDYLIIAPTFRILQQSTMQKFQEYWRGTGVYNKAESVFRMKGGYTFFLRSADNPPSIEGITAKGIWADEASLMKPDIWVMMLGRVSRTMGRILMTFTPISLNWVHKEIERDKKEAQEKKRERDIEFIQFRSIDSPYFPREEYERAKRTLPSHIFGLRYEGIFGKPEGLVYPDFTGISGYHVCKPFAVPKEWRKGGGIDFGHRPAPFVALKGAIDPATDILYVYDEYYQTEKTYDQHKDYLSRDFTYFADPSGAQDIAELQQRGIDTQSAINDVGPGINAVTERIKTNRLRVFEGCINLIDEFALYQYERNQTTGEWRDKPLKANDHCMDALRYLIMGLDSYVKPEIWWA
jgi:PBSX family phage terminase large subunit